MNVITEERLIDGLNGKNDLFDPNSHLMDAVRSDMQFKNPILAQFAKEWRDAEDGIMFRPFNKENNGAKFPDIEELWDKIEAGKLSQ